MTEVYVEHFESGKNWVGIARDGKEIVQEQLFDAYAGKGVFSFFLKDQTLVVFPTKVLENCIVTVK